MATSKNRRFERINRISVSLDNGLNAVFERGMHYLIEAPSGTGKSSLCNFIYGLRNGYCGSIMLDNCEARLLSTHEWIEVRRRHIAYLPQNMELFPELSGFENVAVKNALTNTFSTAEIERMFHRLEIGDCINKKAGIMSVGEQQRVAVIRALCQAFDFLLLDEPVSHLDAVNNSRVAGLITEVAARNQAAIVATSVGNAISIENLNIVKL